VVVLLLQLFLLLQQLAVAKRVMRMHNHKRIQSLSFIRYLHHENYIHVVLQLMPNDFTRNWGVVAHW